MGLITSFSQLINLMTGGNSGAPEHIFLNKTPFIAGAQIAADRAETLESTWLCDGIPTHGSVPTTAAVCDATTVGGLMQTNPAGGKQKWLVGMNLCHSDTIGVHFILYDRLLHCGGMSGTVTTAQNCGGSITRYTDGLGNKIWLEIYTTVGATPQTVTAIYVNENGATHTTQATAIGGATLDKTQSRIIALPLQAGDRGVKSVTSVTLSGSTGTAGNFGVTIAHPLCTTMFGIVSGLERIFDGYPSAIEILTDACLGIAEFGARGIIPNVYGQISFVEA